MRVTHEGVVLGADAPIDTLGERSADIGTGPQGGKTLEKRIARQRREDALLVVVLNTGEEEQTVLLGRTADPAARLPAGEERIGRQRIPLERRVGGQVVIAEKEECTAAEIVAAGSRDH